MNLPLASIWPCFILSVCVKLGEAAVPRVYGVTPQCGSINGGTRITVSGQNRNVSGNLMLPNDFARNYFNFGTGNENLGSRVSLAGALTSYACDLHPDGSHETQVTCYTQPMPEGTYTVKVTVDGEDVLDINYCSTASNCEFKVSSSCTPTVLSIKPTSGLPGEFIELTGNLITDKYGANEPDETKAMILRVYFGGQKCELRDALNDSVYGLTFDGTNGYMKCKTEGTYIGNHDISFLVSNEYGRSLPLSTLKQIHRNGIGMYQTFTEISGLSLHEGSTEGSTLLTIHGQYFDETDAKANIFIGDKECLVISPISDTEIKCLTPKDASDNQSHYSGGRGLYVYIQNGTTDASSIDRNKAAVEHIDQSSWSASNWGPHAIQIIGFFVPLTSGNYTFCLKAANAATLYMSSDSDPTKKSKIISGTSCTESAPIYLQADKKYYTEVYYGSDASNSFVTLIARSLVTELTPEMTGLAQYEVQDIFFKSSVNPEIQTVTISVSGTPSKVVNDIQTITFLNIQDASIVLGLDEAFTVPIQINQLTNTALQNELKNLPNAVTIVNTDIKNNSSHITIVITSSSTQGAISGFNGKLIGGNLNESSFTSIRTVLGKPDLTTFTLTMDDKPTKPIPINAANLEVQKALEELFSVRCNSVLKTGTYLQDFEQASDKDSSVEPFCGRYSVKNRFYIYDKQATTGLSVSSSSNKFMCLAYKGQGRVNYIRVSFAYKDSNFKDATVTGKFYVPNNKPDEWSFWCGDVFNLFNSVATGTAVKIEYVQVYRIDTSQDLYIDHLLFNKVSVLSFVKAEDIYLLRMPQSQPNGAFINNIIVEGSYPTYTIKLQPHNCGYNFPLFGVASADHIDSIYMINNGGFVSINITSVIAASPPIGGNYTVALNGETTPDPVQISDTLSPEPLIGGLSSMSIGFSKVEVTGTCSAFKFRVTMLSLKGDQPSMLINSSGLTGIDVTVTVKKVTDGGVSLSPIMGDLLRTYHSEPQVLAYINNVPTRCQMNSSCSFKWSSNQTPIVTNIQPATGSQDLSVVIMGEGFDATSISNNEVVIGTTPCNITTFNSSLITCLLGNGATGTVNVYVTVANKGLARSSVQFTYITDIISVSPSSGSVEGGTLLTINGKGFTADANVTVDSRQCDIENLTQSTITCRTPRAQSFISDKTAEIVVAQFGSSKVAGNFTYMISETPVVQSVIRSTSKVNGGEQITITGQGFGSTPVTVKLGNTTLNITSSSDTSITAVLPALPDGSYRLIIDIDNKAFADLRKNNIPDIVYTLNVESMSPNFGSLYGGTDLFITGNGFSLNTSEMSVTVGHHNCSILNLSDTSIKCRIEDTGKYHIVSATGKHKILGYGYAWDKDPVTIQVGDYITWTWKTPQYVSDIAYSVQQTATPFDLFPLPGGFSSGAKKRIGSFTHRFTTAGNFYYWTGYMDSENNIYFRGTVIVLAQNSYLVPLSVKLLGFEARHITSNSTPHVLNDTKCPFVVDRMSGCVDSVSLTESTDYFQFKFLKCYSPYIDNINLDSGTFTDVVTLSGKGLGTEVCQNEVIYGTSKCTITSSTETSINLTISSEEQPPIGEFLQFSPRIVNLGYALVAIPRDAGHRFRLLPKIQSISPSTGSKAGGTLLTINGEGFQGDADSVSVELTKLSCSIKSVTYTKVICETVCESACNSGNQTVSLIVGGGSFPAICDPSVCLFTTLDEYTAVLYSVYPSEISTESTVLTIVGSNFNTSDKLQVKIGGQDCPIKDIIESNNFTCTIGRLPVGANDIKLYVGNKGLAVTTQKVTSKAVAAISLPYSSSVYGGAFLVIDGNGFTPNTSVKVDTSECPLVNISLSQVTCILPQHIEGLVNVSLVSNKILYNSLSINYSLQSTPKVTSVNPNGGTGNTEITITGTGFISSATEKTPEVKIGGIACTNVKDVNATSITCTTGAQNTGKFPVQVFVEQRGFSNSDVMFTYQLGSFSVTPETGSTNGGQLVTLTGSGFLQGKTTVTICGAVCNEVNVTTSDYVCITSPATGNTNNCDIIASVEGVTNTQKLAYSYNNSLDASVTSVSPARGGTGGGTVLTITGTNFGSAIEEISVKISGTVCNVTSVTDTQILCRTGAASSGTTVVDVQRKNWGLAKKVNAVFQYIDLWSSPYTWGGESPPTDGDFVVIPPNQIILLDTNTSVLKMLLIQGQLIFDETNIELQAENILITNNGLLQVGSAEKPFPKQCKAIITLHGHLRSKELPVYGTKTLAIREGTLNLYGTPVNVVWTRLANTASPGSTILNLEHEVDWSPGDEIVIATTGDKFSQKETEVRKIVSVNGANVTLDKALDYEHLGIVGQFGDRQVDFKAEVGLLTRNVVVRGHRNVEFDTEIPACAAGFDPGEFATQTCFQGRFGEELGSDQFGGQIMVHQMEKDTQVAQAHLQYIEVTFAGQAFRLGRYAIHFHMNGNMNKSFVRGCSIHKSFNRAVNIHGSHNALVEHNVVYDIMGGALFLEDGNEVGNTFQYNLVLFVRSSTSLRNDDITPAGFWATNPNNTIRHNNVAGGTHFGVWYRMHVHPDGPGFDVNICPQATPLGEYSNNTAHSLGWFGLWIFESYIPRVDSSCSSNAEHQVAKFYTLTAWSCDKGAEAVNIGAVQFHNFTLVNNLNTGFESKLIVQAPPQYDANRGPGIFNSLIAAYYSGLRGGSSSSGVVIPYQTGFLIKDVQFFNFDQPGHATFSWTRIAGICTHFCGGFTVETEGLHFINSSNKVRYDWESEGVVLDRDGSLTGNANFSVAPCTPSFDSNKCTLNQEMSVNVNGCICTSDLKLIRFSFNNIIPTSLKGANALFSTEFGTSYSPFAPKRITHPQGWSFVLMANHYYKFSFDHADKISNMSYDSVMYRLDLGDFIVFTQYAEARPDIFSLNGQQTTLPMASTMLSGSSVNHGQWFYNDTEKSITYAVVRQNKRKRSIYMTAKEISINARCIKCFYIGCQPPQDPLDILNRPSNAEYWSYNSTWNSVTADGSEPKTLDDLVIPKNKWIIVDKPLPKLGKLVLEGGLEFLEDESRDVVLDVEYLLITGRLVAGWNSSAPLKGKLVIRLRGSISSTPYPTSSGPLLGTRFIGVFGGLQLHGKDRGIIKTYLSSTVDSGNVITVTDAVSWVPGDVILITTSDYHPWHTETFTITSISETTITLNATIKYRHIAYTTTLKSTNINLSAVVALLSRNIKIEGENYDQLMKDSHGARVIVSQTFYNGSTLSGFAQISNVEFYHTGQEGYKESYDPRFSIAFVDVISTPGKLRYSYVRKSSFYCGFNTAIGAFAVNGLEIDSNIIYYTVNAGIRTEATKTQITNNLVTLSLWPGSYNGRNEPDNPSFEGAIEAILADDLVLINNTVAGSERAGYHLKGQLCNTTVNNLWNGNTAIGTLVGVLLLPADIPISYACAIFNGFTLWKNFDFGIYHNNRANGIFQKNILVENGVGIFPMIIGPNEVLHVFEDKFVKVISNIFIGKTPTFLENVDIISSTDKLLNFSGNVRGDGSRKPCGKIGLEITTFTGGSNMAPGKPFVSIMAYPTQKGITELKGNTYANYNVCTGGRDYALTTNKNNDDGNFPLLIQNTDLINVNHLSKVFFHYPNVEKINPADCVDMDCDGLKKCMIQDLDGTFLGHIGTVLPNSAYEWDGDPRHGLGDYRIPLLMLTSSNGKKIDVKSYAPHKGIFKTDNCTWLSEWNAFECGNNYEWRILTLESMDEDTETRRLSPVAVYHPDGYVDLINGPQDHGWCSGYTCQKRVSTFQAIVALDQPFDVYLTSTNPNVMRFILLSSDSKECLRLGLQLQTANRPEIRVNNSLVMPTNGYTDSKGRFRLKLQETTGQYMPEITSKTNGENFYSRDENMIFWIMCGNSEVTVTQTEALIISFTLAAITEDQFYGEKIVENFAAFLNMDPKKVRIVDIKRDTSANGRRKRATETITLVIEIANEPGDNATINYSNVSEQISIQIQLHGFNDVLNVTVLSTSIQEPGVLLNSSVALQTPDKLVMDTAPVGDVLERMPLSVQPRFKIVDTFGNVIENLGYKLTPWIITASIKYKTSSQSMIEHASAQFVNGWANFTELTILLRGTYTLEFRVTSPPEFSSFYQLVNSIKILGHDYQAQAELRSNSPLTDTNLQLVVGLIDKSNNQHQTDLNWNLLTWSAQISLLDNSIYPGVLTGNLTTSFNNSTGYAVFSDIKLNKPGKCKLQITVQSDPALYSLSTTYTLELMSLEQSSLRVEEKHTIELKFDIEYSLENATLLSAQVRNYYSQLTGLRIVSDSYKKGSIIVVLVIEATKDGYNQTINSMCDNIINNGQFTFAGTAIPLSKYITVDGLPYINGSCSALKPPILGHDYQAQAELRSNSPLTDTNLQLVVGLIDKSNNQHQTDLNWNLLTWSAQISLLDNSIYPGVLTGNLTTSFNNSTGYAVFSDIKLNKPGKCKLQITVQSDPALYSLSTTYTLELMSLEQSSLRVEEKHTIELKFDIEYSLENATLLSAQVRNYYSQLTGLRIVSDSYKKGSIIVVLVIEATKDGYNQTINSMCDNIINNGQFTFAGTAIPLSKYITVDGLPYINGSCSALKPPESSNSEFPVKYIIIIVVLSALLLLVIFILVYKLYIQPKAKTHSFFNKHNDHMEYSLMSKENTFLTSRPQTPSMPPVNTMNREL